MTIKGGCLCGAVRFEIDAVQPPFEMCHCSRCRKVSGAQGIPAITVKGANYRMTQGANNIKYFEAPILYQPPVYTATFCGTCGSPVTPPNPDADYIEVAAGLLDDDPGLMPDKHIFIEHLPDWDQVTDGLPTFTRDEIRAHRGQSEES